MRFREHKNSFNRGKRASALAEYLLDANHEFSIDLSRPIHFEGDYRQRRALSDVEIYRHKEEHGDFVFNKFVNEIDWYSYVLSCDGMKDEIFYVPQ